MFVIGNYCSLRVGTAGTQAQEEVGIASDVKCACEIDEVESTCRRNKGNKSYIYGLSDHTLTFTLKHDVEDEQYQQILEAHTTKKALAFGALDDKGNGPEGDWIVSKFELDQKDNEIVGVNVTARPTFIDGGKGRNVAWIKGTASPTGA